MSSFLEIEILNKFIEAIVADDAIPKELAKSISVLQEQGKLSVGTHLKKVIEEFVPQGTGLSDESK